KIVKTVLSNMQSVVPCDKVALFLIDSGGNGTARIYTNGSGSENPADLRQIPVVFTPEEWQRLETTDGSLIVESGDESLRLLAPISGNGVLRFVLFPLLHKKSLAGVLAMGFGPGSKQVREDLLRARQIGDQVVVALANAGLFEELAQFNRGAMTALARAVDAKSPWTSGHSERVTALSLAIGREMGLTAKELDTLHRGGMLHDIGKIGIPGSILDKPGKLTRDEFAIIQEHPGKGARILEPIPAFREVIPIVTEHHERFDGKGYPRGLSGEAISLGARILAVADVYDALTSDRPYRVALRPEEALSYVVENGGLQFDPAVTQIFRNIISREEAMSIFRKNRPVSIAGHGTITK
ncbi:MAG TPA: HD domain-containing phosphohydrolase, partial [Candidatus Deferrimicrobiaceae bacterium]|nr:HD domain-containing phosphohydrolase [Candidatus Deferrimicrobiaceae bacterium]